MKKSNKPIGIIEQTRRRSVGNKINLFEGNEEERFDKEIWNTVSRVCFNEKNPFLREDIKRQIFFKILQDRKILEYEEKEIEQRVKELLEEHKKNMKGNNRKEVGDLVEYKELNDKTKTYDKIYGIILRTSKQHKVIGYYDISGKLIDIKNVGSILKKGYLNKEQIGYLKGVKVK